VCRIVRILHCVFAYRLPGRVSVVRKLREAFDIGGTRPSLDDVDIHSVASLLKAYLCDLPQPIIPVAHYDRVMHIVTRQRPVDSAAAITALSDAVQQLPRANYNLLHYLCAFLHDVACYSEVNRMTASNLAVVFSPCFIKPEIDDPALLAGTAVNRTTAVQDMIENFNSIFPANGDSETDTCNIASLMDVNTKEPAQCLLNGTVTHLPPDVVMGAGRSADNVEENTEGSDLVELGSSRVVSDGKVNIYSSLHEQSTDVAEPVTEVGRELQSKIVMLQQQLHAERRSVCDLRRQLITERMEAARQTEQLAKQLDEERTATSSAVARVVELQTKLEQYSVKYGPLD